MDYKGKITFSEGFIKQAKLSGSVTQFKGSIKQTFKTYKNIMCFKDDVYMFKDKLILGDDTWKL